MNVIGNMDNGLTDTMIIATTKEALKQDHKVHQY